MSGAKHTPGPWRVEHGTIYGNRKGWSACGFAIAATRVSSSNMEGDDDLREVQEANARLIAAAPAMMEALEALLDGNPYSGVGSLDSEITKAVEAIQKGREALAAARGEETE